MAGAIEFSALAKQCLDRRIATIETLEKEVLTWTEKRNEKQVKINRRAAPWLFDTAKARQKLKRHYVKVNAGNSTIPDSNN